MSPAAALAAPAARPRPDLMVWAVAACAGLVAARLGSELLKHQPLALDFLALWTGGRIAMAHPAQLYDFAAVTHAQAWLLGDSPRQRPFPYPPSALLLFVPLGAAPFWVAAAAWLAATLTAFAAVAARVAADHRRWAVALVLLAPTTVWAAVSGQTTFLIGALAIGGVLALERRPWLAGVLLGAAAAIKPSLLVMAPVALVAGGHWRSLLAAALTGAGLVLASLAAFGLQPWIDWVGALPRFLAQIATDPAFNDTVVTPGGLAARLGFVGGSLSIVRWMSVFVGLMSVIVVFCREKSAPLRLTALLGAGLLATPYAMNYDAALLVPGAAALMLTNLQGPRRLPALTGYAALIAAAVPGVCALGLLAFLAATLVPRAPAAP